MMASVVKKIFDFNINTLMNESFHTCVIFFVNIHETDLIKKNNTVQERVTLAFFI